MDSRHISQLRRVRNISVHYKNSYLMCGFLVSTALSNLWSMIHDCRGCCELNTICLRIYLHVCVHVYVRVCEILWLFSIPNKAHHTWILYMYMYARTAWTVTSKMEINCDDEFIIINHMKAFQT